ncbi:hypothetical protein ES703_06998 [subsurface metagenome]
MESDDKSKNLVNLIVAISILISLLSGLNQIKGFFSKISLPTAILSVLIAISVAVALPAQLRKKIPKDGTILRMSFRVFSILFAILILVVGVGPFLVKYQIATQAKSEGMDLIDLHRCGPALYRLNLATAYFGDLGFDKRAVESKLNLIQAYVGLGDWAKAEDLIKEVEISVFLDAHLQGKLYGIRGNMAYERGEFEQAEHLYQIALQTVEPRSQVHASVLQNQAVLWAGKGSPYRDRVLVNYQQAWDIFQELEDELGLAQLLVNEGNLYENDPQQARELYERALSKAEKIQDPYLLGSITMNIGVTYFTQGDLDQAEELYNQARLKFEEAADLLGQAEVLVNLATVEYNKGYSELARQYLQASESYLRNIDLESEQTHVRKVAQIRTFQADIYDSFGESEDAEDLYIEALALYSQHPDPLREATARVNYGGLLLRLNRGQEAFNEIGRAREILEAYGGEGPQQSLGVLYNNLGYAYQNIGDLTNAQKYYEEALQVFEALEDRLSCARVRENLGIIQIWQGGNGEEDLLYALQIYRELGNQDDEVKSLYNLYCVYTSSGDPSAPSMVEEILELLENYSIDQETEARILFGILIPDIADQVDLIVYRERLLQLKLFYEERDEPIGLGRSLLKLANVEQILGNYQRMLEYAKNAEAYADYIPLPLRFSFHTDLGFFLVSDDPENGIDHFFEAFDLAGSISVEQQRYLAILIECFISINKDIIDSEKYHMKAQRILDTADDAYILSMFQMIVDHLNSAGG